MVEFAGQVRERITPMPGEVWLKDGENRPVIITSLTWQRITFVTPQAGQGDEKPYRESYVGAEYFFADEWTRLWPPVRGGPSC